MYKHDRLFYQIAHEKRNGVRREISLLQEKISAIDLILASIDEPLEPSSVRAGEKYQLLNSIGVPFTWVPKSQKNARQV